MLLNFPISFVNRLLLALRAKLKCDKLAPYRVDGTIVGNGSQDFTKDYKTYTFEIGDVPTQLLDCPGIEGDEGRFQAIIEGALKKCHLVCYVAREAKGIETTTLERIRVYLRENVEVLGIQNIPFNPTREYDGSDYDRDMRERLDKEAKNGRNIEEALLSILPRELYVRTVNLSALPGLCGAAVRNGETTFADAADYESPDAVHDSLETLCRQQRNFLRHTTAEKLFESSQILELKNAIVSCCQDAPVRIKKNSYRRLLQALRDVYIRPLKDEEKELNRLKTKVAKKVDAYTTSVEDAKIQLSRNMQYAVRNAIDEFYRTDVLEKIVYPHIERHVGIEKDILETEFANNKEQLSIGLRTKITNAIQTATTEFCERIQQYTGELVHGMKLDVASIDADMPYLEGESFGLSDLGSWALNIGGYALSGATIGSFFPVVGSIIGGLIGAFIGIVVNFLPHWGWLDGVRINRAKKKARDAMDESARKFFAQIGPGISQCVKTLSDRTNDGVAKAANKKTAANEMHKVICRAIEQLTEIEQTLVAQINWMTAENDIECC